MTSIVTASPLGRGGHRVVFTGQTATKTVTGAWEPTFMAEHRDVFVPVLWRVESLGNGGLVEYAMPECLPAGWDDIQEALPKAAPLLQKLWATAAPLTNMHWASALFRHLRDVVAKEHLQLRDEDVRFLVHECQHHRVMYHRCIHGDATLANIVYDGSLTCRRWRWIDPLLRPYIPGDPLVDLGKMYQSCLGYERVLAGLNPDRDDALIESLAEQLDMCEYHGLVWCAVHLVRLIPYQHDHDKPIFAELLHDLLDELRAEHTDD